MFNPSERYFLNPSQSLPPFPDSVECYNLKRNDWTLVSHMSEPHYGHAGSVHGDLMYVSGNEGKVHLLYVSIL